MAQQQSLKYEAWSGTQKIPAGKATKNESTQKNTDKKLWRAKKATKTLMEKNDAENILWVFSCIHEGWLTKLYVLDRDSLGDQKEKLLMVRYRTFILLIDPFILFKCDDTGMIYYIIRVRL